MEGRTTVKASEGEIFPYFSDDPDFILDQIEREPPLCMILSEDLTPAQINMLVKKYYIFVVPYGDGERLAIAGGYYKEKQEFFDKPDPDRVKNCSAYKKWAENGEEDDNVFEKLIENPLSILLDKSLEGERLEMMARSHEIINVEHNVEYRQAIACAYMDPDHKTEGRVIAQEKITFGEI